MLFLLIILSNFEVIVFVVLLFIFLNSMVYVFWICCHPDVPIGKQMKGTKEKKKESFYARNFFC
jgi:hypothetical protein